MDLWAGGRSRDTFEEKNVYLAGEKIRQSFILRIEL